MPELDPSVILITGGGGREHALAWTLARSPTVSHIYVAPGNGGTAGEEKVENVGIDDHDVDGLVALARQRSVGLTIVGPERGLAAGVVDGFIEARLPVFGPTRAAARLESSKVWAREFMAQHGIPHPPFVVCELPDDALKAVGELEGDCVVKADGLAAGKGVIVCNDMDSAREAIDTIMVERRFGESGARVLVEQRMRGPELSIMAICDGSDHVLLAPAQDHKRLLEGDRGPNTGGMGAFAPAMLADPETIQHVRSRIIEPTLRGMADAGTPFTGCLFCGLMMTQNGPVVIEFNVRFGDPETQVQLPLIRTDLAEVLRAAARGSVADADLEMDGTSSAVCVVLASRGYPSRSESGIPIDGVETAESRSGIKVLHAGTKTDDDGRIVTSGGRVLNVVCVRDGLAAAVSGAYSVIGDGGVHFDGMIYRTDIAFRAVSERRT